MAETAENVAQEFVDRSRDRTSFALRSQQRAAAAIASGRMAEEIVPVSVAQRGDPIAVMTDEHPRDVARGARQAQGSQEPTARSRRVTRGVNDGARALILASERRRSAHGLTPRARSSRRGRRRSTPHHGLRPYRPPARCWPSPGSLVRDGRDRTQRGVRRTGTRGDARPRTARRCAPVNPNGGAIAHGHPLGRERRPPRHTAYNCGDEGPYALCTMCIGVGQGIAHHRARVRRRATRRGCPWTDPAPATHARTNQ